MVVRNTGGYHSGRERERGYERRWKAAGEEEEEEEGLIEK